MNYKVGDTVVCIDATDLPGTIGISMHTFLCVGQEYVVDGFHECQGVTQTIVKGVFRENECTCGFKDNRARGRSWRFIKLDGLQQETETCNDLAISTIE